MVLFAAGSACAEPEARSIGFSTLVFRIEGDDALGLAKADFRVRILGELQSLGFVAVGAESSGVEKDRGDAAEVLLGGTVHELECQNVPQRGGACRLAIDWELLDTHLDAVVYRALTRGVVYQVNFEKPNGVGEHLVLAALRSLTQRQAFRDQLRRSAQSTAEAAPTYPSAKKRPPPTVVDAADAVPSLDPELDAYRAQQAAGQRARNEAELHEREANAARVARDKEQTRRSDAATPTYVNVMKWGGAGLAVAGIAGAIATYSSYHADTTPEGRYHSLRLGNDLSWVALGLGGAAFGLSFALRPSLSPPKKSATKRGVALTVQPTRVQLGWSF
ncbi:MAG TPA: hypothetical protein VER96_28295 [Polyangiaceae bacterium]|nr:hypothetical protein [Polyangiaceae bacterium]